MSTTLHVKWKDLFISKAPGSYFFLSSKICLGLDMDYRKNLASLLWNYSDLIFLFFVLGLQETPLGLFLIIILNTSAQLTCEQNVSIDFFVRERAKIPSQFSFLCSLGEKNATGAGQAQGSYLPAATGYSHRSWSQ